MHREDPLRLLPAIMSLPSVLLPCVAVSCCWLLNPALIFFCVLVSAQGDVKLLQQWTGEACFNKLSSEAKQRKADGMVLVSLRTVFLPLELMFSLTKGPITASPCCVQILEDHLGADWRDLGS